MFAWGNPSRGDDGVGPWFADRFCDFHGADFELVEGFQLQVEHLLDCQQADLLLFVDANCDHAAAEDYCFCEIAASQDISHSSHQLTPQELLGHYQRVFNQAPPPAFLLTVPGRQFELGTQMSTTTLQCCEQAAQLAEQLLRQPHVQVWREHVRLDPAGAAHA